MTHDIILVLGLRYVQTPLTCSAGPDPQTSHQTTWSVDAHARSCTCAAEVTDFPTFFGVSMYINVWYLFGVLQVFKGQRWEKHQVINHRADDERQGLTFLHDPEEPTAEVITPP